MSRVHRFVILFNDQQTTKQICAARCGWRSNRSAGARTAAAAANAAFRRESVLARTTRFRRRAACQQAASKDGTEARPARFDANVVDDVRLGATTAYLASEFNVSEASALDTITTITRIVQLRMLAFSMRLDEDEIDILLGPSQLLRREFWDTTKVPRARARKKWSHDIDNNLN